MSQAGILNAGGGGGGSPIETITGNDGIPESPLANNFNFLTANSTVKFLGSSATETLNFGITNLALGSSMPSVTTGNDNCFFGLNAGSSITTGNLNVGIGYQALQNATAASDCVAIGFRSMQNQTFLNANSSVAVGSLSMQAAIDCNDTVSIGYQSLQNCTHGGSNTCVGWSAGSNYTTTESNNIILGWNILGTAGESNVTRIGAFQTKCYVSGITGNTVSNAQFVTINSVTGQLGVTTSLVGFQWIVVTSADNPVTLAPEFGYIAKGPGVVQFVLPASAVVGDTYWIKGIENLWTLGQNALQTISIGFVTSGAGVLHGLNATQVKDTVQILCVTANTEFEVLTCIGNPEFF